MAGQSLLKRILGDVGLYGAVALYVAFALLPIFWTVKISVGSALIDYTLYAYPSDCRPQHERFARVPGVTPLPCVKR